MSKFIWQEHLVIDPDLHHGDPCIRGTRIPVSIIVGSLADGMTPADIQAAYPQLSLADIQAALAYAAQPEDAQCELADGKLPLNYRFNREEIHER